MASGDTLAVFTALSNEPPASAFATFEFFENGYFTYNVIRIFDHKFIASGKIYKPG